MVNKGIIVGAGILALLYFAFGRKANAAEVAPSDGGGAGALGATVGGQNTALPQSQSPFGLLLDFFSQPTPDDTPPDLSNEVLYDYGGVAPPSEPAPSQPTYNPSGTDLPISPGGTIVPSTSLPSSPTPVSTSGGQDLVLKHGDYVPSVQSIGEQLGYDLGPVVTEENQAQVDVARNLQLIYSYQNSY